MPTVQKWLLMKIDTKVLQSHLVKVRSGSMVRNCSGLYLISLKRTRKRFYSAVINEVLKRITMVPLCSSLLSFLEHYNFITLLNDHNQKLSLKIIAEYPNSPICQYFWTGFTFFKRHFVGSEVNLKQQLWFKKWRETGWVHFLSTGIQKVLNQLLHQMRKKSKEEQSRACFKVVCESQTSLQRSQTQGEAPRIFGETNISSSTEAASFANYRLFIKYVINFHRI